MAPGYLDRRARPQQLADVVQHDCITVVSPKREACWRLLRDTIGMAMTVRGRFAVNSPGLMAVLAERSMGIAVLAHNLAREGGDGRSAGTRAARMGAAQAAGACGAGVTPSIGQRAGIR